MADSNNPQIVITAQDNASPTFDRIIAGLQRLEQAGQEQSAWLTNLATMLGSQQQAAQAATQSTNQLATAYLALAQATKEQTQVYAQVQAKTLAAKQEQDALRESMRRAHDEARAGTSVWQQLFNVAAGVGLATSLTALVGQMRAFLTESVSLAAKMQDLNLAFKSIDGSGAAANATLAHLFDTSQRLGVNFVEVAEGFKRMDQAAKGTALEGQGIRQVFDNLLAGARVLGVSSQQAQQAIVALEQILTKGKLSAEEYRRQLGNAIPGALKLMADGLGVSTQALEQMIASGVIPAQAAVIAFGKAMGDLGGHQGAETIERLTSTFAQLKNETTAWMTSIGEGIGSAIQPFLKGLIDISEQLRTLFNIRAPGQQAVPGANRTQGSWLNSILNPFLPEILGTPAPGTYGPTEQHEPGFISSRFDALIRQNAERTGIDPAMFSRLIQRETGGTFDPRSTGPAIPGQGNARGLGQIMPATGEQYGLASITDFYNPEKNLAASANIFRDYREALRKFFDNADDLQRATLAAYNAGIGNVLTAIEETKALGEKITPGQVIGRLRGVAETRPYVEAIAGPLPLPSRVGSAAEGPTVDPVANMLLTVGKTVDETLTGITAFQKKMDDLNASGLNFAGVMGKDITDGADELVKKFTQAGNLLITFPGLLGRMSTQQRELVALAAEQVAKFQQRMQDETQSEGPARKRVQELAQAERLQEQLTVGAEKQIADMRIATTLAEALAAAGGDPSEEQRARNAAEEATLRQTMAEKGYGAAITETQVALLRRRQAAADDAETIKTMVKEQHERMQQVAKDLDIFGLNLSPGEEAQRAFSQKVEQAVEAARAPRAERPEVQLRAEASKLGLTPSPQDEARLKQLTATRLAAEQAHEMERIAQGLARNIQSTFDNLWEQIFTGGVTSFRQLGLVVAQSLQRMFAQLTSQLMNALLNAVTGATEEKGGWAGLVARGTVSVIGNLLGGGAASASEAAGAIQGFRDAGFTQGVVQSARGNVFPGLGTIRSMANGGVVSTPSFTTIAELGKPEAVVPLPDNRTIPVSFTNQGQQQQPVIIEIHNDWSNSIAPSQLKTGKKEIIQHVINDIRGDNSLRRIIQQYAR